MKPTNGQAKEEAKKLAEEHWAWLVRLLEMVYKDAFIHGYKHGQAEEVINES